MSRNCSFYQLTLKKTKNRFWGGDQSTIFVLGKNNRVRLRADTYFPRCNGFSSASAVFLAVMGSGSALWEDSDTNPHRRCGFRNMKLKNTQNWTPFPKKSCQTTAIIWPNLVFFWNFASQFFLFSSLLAYPDPDPNSGRPLGNGSEWSPMWIQNGISFAN